MKVHHKLDALDSNGDCFTELVTMKMLTIPDHDAKRRSGASSEAQFPHQWFLNKVVGAAPIKQVNQLVSGDVAQQTQGLKRQMTRERVEYDLDLSRVSGIRWVGRALQLGRVI